jgi:hypothetical protein
LVEVEICRLSSIKGWLLAFRTFLIGYVCEETLVAELELFSTVFWASASTLLVVNKPHESALMITMFCVLRFIALSPVDRKTAEASYPASFVGFVFVQRY